MPYFSSVFSSLVWVVCENHGFSQVKDLRSHRFLAERGAVLGNYFAVTHPSGPNYRAMAAGRYWTRNELYGQTKPTVATVTGVPTTVWRFKGPPARRHNPFVDLNSPISTVKDLDLESLPDACILYVGLDDENNGHSGPLKVADDNLCELIERLDNSQWFNREVNGLHPALFVVWDEAYSASNQVFAAFYGRGVAEGASSNDKLNHLSFCRLVCENWQQAPLEEAASATPITGI